MLFRTFGIIFLAICFSFAFSLSDSPGQKSAEYYVAIQNAITFLREHKTDLNVDALFGVQIARSQAWMLSHTFDFSSSFLHKSIIATSTKLIKESIIGIIQRDPEYYQRIGPLLDQHHWSKINCETRCLGSINGEEEEVLSKMNLTETLSDYCLAELFSSSSCKQSGFCQKRMLEENYTDYGRAHQLLYLYISFQKHCISPYENRQKSQQICGKMYQQNVAIERSGFPNLDQDIFMENLLFCGYLGYSDFLRNPLWNRSILSWQSPQSGCYPVEIVQRFGPISGQQKRRDKIVDNHCSLHKTSIAIGALAIIHNRQLLDQICPF